MTATLEPTAIKLTALDDARVSEAAHNAATELGRVDTKAAMMLALAGAFAAGLGAAEAGILTTPSVPRVAAYGAGAALVLIGGAVDRLLRAVQPNLAGSHGIVAYAKAATDSDAARMVADRQSGAVLRWTSRAAVAKYRQIRAAIGLLRAALAVTVLTTVVTAVVAVVGWGW